MKTRLIVIGGATATGKSELALSLAQRLNSVIISADSRQIYREFDIGTAKPSLAQRELVPHYLIDICDPQDNFTVAQYQEQVNTLIKTFSLDSPPLLLVGGTGLYIKSIVRGLKIPRVSPQPELRSQLSHLGQSHLYALLSQVDPLSAAKIHFNDHLRTLRALEVFYVTGQPISAQQGENPPDYPILSLGLDCDPQDLEKRIQKRTQEMISIGLIAETEKIAQKYGWDLPLLNTLGYAETKQYLAGDLSLSAATHSIILHTRQFAKRQRTWFRSDPEIKWFNSNAPDLLEQVWQFTLSTKAGT